MSHNKKVCDFWSQIMTWYLIRAWDNGPTAEVELSHGSLGGKKITWLENDIDIGGRAKEMCPNIKTIDTWLLYAA